MAFFAVIIITGATFIGAAVQILRLVGLGKWFAPIFKQRAYITKSSVESIHSDVSKFSFRHSGIAVVLSKVFSSLGFHSHRDTPQGDAENMGEKGTISEEPPTNRASGEMLRTKFQGNVKNVSMLNSAVIAFLSAGNQHKCNYSKALLSPRSRLHNDTNVHSVPATQLIVPPQPGRTIEFSRYGKIHDIAYSEDGKWLAVAWSVLLIVNNDGENTERN